MTRIKHTPKPTTNKWTRRIAQRQERKNQKEEERIIIDSEATSHSVTEELNLPRTGPSELTVSLPDDSTLRATGTTQLPFEQLSTKAKKAHILPGLTKSLISVKKMAESGYTTIFRSGDERVTFHKVGTLTITMSDSPVLQGCKRKGETLWTVSAPQTTRKKPRGNLKCIQLAFHLPNNRIPPRLSGIPSQGIMDKSTKCRKLHNMARLNISGGTKALPRI